jgi:3-phenylpropionate/trans-cinnamate dioxygenase ferredoxin subunit
LVEFYDAVPIDWIGPGETEIVEVDGWPVAIANIDGSFHAFQALCPHQGTKLGGRPLEEGCFITCPQHSSRYNVVTGECVRPSSEDGFNQDLNLYELRIVDDVIQVAL